MTDDQTPSAIESKSDLPAEPAVTGEAAPAATFPDGTPIPADAVAAADALPPAASPIAPTVGRVVYCVLPKEFKRGGEIRPAIIVRVNQGSCNLSVLLDGPNDAEGGLAAEAEWMGSVAFDQDTKLPGTWHWMPFQVGQAKRSEVIFTAEQMAIINGVCGGLDELCKRIEKVEAQKAPAPVVPAKVW